MRRESAALVFLRTERVFIWSVIDFTPDLTPGHTRDLTTALVRLRRADKARERQEKAGQLIDTCSTPDFA